MFIESLDKSIAAFDGVNRTVFYRGRDNFQPGEYRIGDKVYWTAYTSVSKSFTEARNFISYPNASPKGELVLFKLHIPPQYGAYVAPVSYYGGEEELLLPRDSCFIVHQPPSQTCHGGHVNYWTCEMKLDGMEMLDVTDSESEDGDDDELEAGEVEDDNVTVCTEIEEDEQKVEPEDELPEWTEVEKEEMHKNLGEKQKTEQSFWYPDPW
jgi:hypothetical protein